MWVILVPKFRQGADSVDDFCPTESIRDKQVQRAMLTQQRILKQTFPKKEKLLSITILKSHIADGIGWKNIQIKKEMSDTGESHKNHELHVALHGNRAFGHLLSPFSWRAFILKGGI